LNEIYFVFLDVVLDIDREDEYLKTWISRYDLIPQGVHFRRMENLIQVYSNDDSYSTRCSS